MTVPKVIASGETITIPAGRVAILPNVQIDGVLNVENGGEVFIPSGATLSSVVEKVTSTDNAIVRFNGTTGEVQNSGVVIDDSGNVGIGLTNPGDRLAVKGNAAITSLTGTTASDGSGVLFYRGSDNYQMAYVGFGTGVTPFEFVNNKNNGFNFYNGEILQKTAYGFGYGAGSGGTVTQLTSKSTAVTLNKPTGRIVMNNASLGAGAKVVFVVYNNLVADTDTIVFSTSSSDNNDAYTLSSRTLNGLFTVRVINTHAIALAEPVTFNFAIIKGATA